jgi:hypothetical protein
MKTKQLLGVNPEIYANQQLTGDLKDLPGAGLLDSALSCHPEADPSRLTALVMTSEQLCRWQKQIPRA